MAVHPDLRHLLRRKALSLPRVPWGEDVIVDERTVDNIVSNLKKKLSWSPGDPWRITTIRGVGYRFETESTASVLLKNTLEAPVQIKAETANHGNTPWMRSL